MKVFFRLCNSDKVSFLDFIILYIVELNVINHDKFPTFQCNEYFEFNPVQT